MPSNKIYLTSNGPKNLLGLKEYDIFKLMESAKKRNYEPLLVTGQEMTRVVEEVPFGVINCTGYPTDSHLRYVRDLELKGSKVVTPIYNSKIADDKMLSYLECSNAGIPCPKTFDLNLLWGVEWNNMIEQIKTHIKFPCIVKAHNSAIGYGVYKVDTPEDFNDLIGLLSCTVYRHPHFHTTASLVVQEYIPETFGRNIRVMVVGEKVLGAIERSNPTYWKTGATRRHPGNVVYGLGGGNEKRTHFEVPDELIEKSLKVVKTLGLGFAGLDFLFGKDEFIFCEANTSPNTKGWQEQHPSINLANEVIDYLITS
jgi:gamma-F420-2:alpha-L-glutamate ligase